MHLFMSSNVIAIFGESSVLYYHIISVYEYKLVLVMSINADDVCEKEIEVDGEPATITLLDTWEAEVR